MAIKFGTDGWRGIIGDDFVFANVEIVTQSIADYMMEKDIAGRGVVLAHDTRFMAERFADLVASVFLANHIKVYRPQGPIPTPLAAFSVRELGSGGAVMLTASHNPYQYNGIKYIPEYGGPAFVEITSRIEELIGKNMKRAGSKGIKKVDPSLSKDMVVEVDTRASYVEHLHRIIDFDKIGQAGLKVVLDPMYGAGGELMALALQEAGVDFCCIHDRRDVLFGGGLPDPSEQNLEDLKVKMKEVGADIGVSLDGDGDRFGVIDSRGAYLKPNELIALFLYFLTAKKGLKRGKVVRTVATTHFIDAIALGQGVQVEETPVGFKYICEKMLEDGVIIGGEESGGLSVQGHIPEKDGILADLLAIEVTAEFRQPLSWLLNELYLKYGHFYNQRLDIQVSPERKRFLLKRLRTHAPKSCLGLPVVKITDLDGLKIELEGGHWFLIRPSGTEPLVRAYVEARDKDLFEKLKDYTLDIVMKY